MSNTKSTNLIGVLGFADLYEPSGNEKFKDPLTGKVKKTYSVQLIMRPEDVLINIPRIKAVMQEAYAEAWQTTDDNTKMILTGVRDQYFKDIDEIISGQKFTDTQGRIIRDGKYKSAGFNLGEFYASITSSPDYPPQICHGTLPLTVDRDGLMPSAQIRSTDDVKRIFKNGSIIEVGCKARLFNFWKVKAVNPAELGFTLDLTAISWNATGESRLAGNIEHDVSTFSQAEPMPSAVLNAGSAVPNLAAPTAPTTPPPPPLAPAAPGGGLFKRRN